ncbi:NAD(P)/FAD-dependent oxidoreductase [Leucobacter sp. HY1908]
MSGMVIVGGGFAGASAAAQLHEEGFTGDITIIAGEAQLPYERPGLSKGYLQGKDDEASVFTHPQAWYDEQRITVRQGISAESFDTKTHTVTLVGGETLEYEKLLLATGSRARTLPIAGADLAGVHTLRTIEDARALHAVFATGGKNIVLVGSGWIGMEAAWAARAQGNTVTVLERGNAPLEAVLGVELGGDFQKLHEAHGTVFRMHANVEGMVGEDGVVTGVQVDGETLPADLVLVGVGAIPNVEIAQAAGLDVENGVLVDASLRTSAPDVFAAGDLANIDHAGAGTRVRSEHWAVALATGKAAAQAMLGQSVSYDVIPFFFTDQWELGMEMAGYPHLMRDAEVVVRGDLAKREYLAFWVKDGRVGGGMNVNVWDVNEQIQDLVRSGVTVDLEKLRDPSVPLTDVAA